MTLQQSRRDSEKIAFLRGLRQIRQLSTQPVPEEALQDILEVARWTGSARNIQPWDLVLIQDRATLQTLAHLEGSHEAKRILGVPPARLLRTIMSIGFPDAEGHRRRARPAQPRKPLSDIVHREKFS